MDKQHGGNNEEEVIMSFEHNGGGDLDLHAGLYECEIFLGKKARNRGGGHRGRRNQESK